MAMNTRLVSHLRSNQVSRVVYGSIIGLALILTLEAHPPETSERSRVAVVIGTMLATALAVALAELYSELVGARTRAGMGGSTEPLGTVVGNSAAVAFGIAFPAVFFVAVALNLIDYDTAFALAKWTGLGLIAAYGYIAARLSGAGTSAALLQASFVALIAATLIVLKAFVH